ncbi:hypothetical protein SDC9_189286 [bioreactor metagenome]|uniref:Uncharacterized protein n=1 Tax=bioreactor metagenome TaxID=1076179 RepID=A0A645HRR5_9ZZZZ
MPEALHIYVHINNSRENDILIYNISNVPAHSEFRMELVLLCIEFISVNI